MKTMMNDEIFEQAKEDYLLLWHRRQITTFGKFLVGKGIIKTARAYHALDRVFRSEKGVVHDKLFEKLELINGLFDEFLEENPIKVG